MGTFSVEGTLELGSIWTKIRSVELNETGPSTCFCASIDFEAWFPRDVVIEGHPASLPLPCRKTFEHYESAIAHPADAHACLNKAAAGMHLMTNDLPKSLGHRATAVCVRRRRLEDRARPKMTWGYWGEAIRATDRIWRDWDPTELDFVMLVEDEGSLARGFLTSGDDSERGVSGCGRSETRLRQTLGLGG